MEDQENADPGILQAHSRYRYVCELVTRPRIVVAYDKHTKQNVAVKLFPDVLTTDGADRLFEAVGLHREANHSCIVKFVELIHVPGHIELAVPGHIGLVMEYICGGNLANLVLERTEVGEEPKATIVYTCPGVQEVRNIFRTALDEDYARRLFRWVFYGLKHLHDNETAHRCLKPENILLSSDRECAKINDFYWSHDGLECLSKVGAPYYIAPEVWMLPANNQNVEYSGRAADIWGLGCVLFYMIYGEPPFIVLHPVNTDDQRLDVLESMVTSVDFRFEDALSVTPSCRALIEGMLKRDPHERMTVEEILNSDWMQNVEPIPDNQLIQTDLQPLESIQMIIDDAVVDIVNIGE